MTLPQKLVYTQVHRVESFDKVCGMKSTNRMKLIKFKYKRNELLRTELLLDSYLYDVSY